MRNISYGFFMYYTIYKCIKNINILIYHVKNQEKLFKIYFIGAGASLCLEKI